MHTPPEDSTTISLEIVPRRRAGMLDDLALVRAHFPQISMVNIPDLLRLSLRSWEACHLAGAHYRRTVPHVRAIDVPRKGDSPVLDGIRETHVREVLVVGGDAPQDIAHRVYPTSSIDVIRRLKTEFPAIKIYAAIDPYRQSIRSELDYIQRKIDAGAEGFFTQPFFDLRLLDIYADLLSGQTVFWGVTPIVSDGSRSYWETTNSAVLPRDFVPSMEWNQAFARRVLAYVREIRGSMYIMPIRIDLQEYLSGIFA